MTSTRIAPITGATPGLGAAVAGALAETVSSNHAPIHLLINNAGIGPGRPPYRKRILSADGHELRFAVSYLAPALLARLRVPTLKNGEPARIINVASAGQAPIDFADLRMDHHYSGTQAYYRSKLAPITAASSRWSGSRSTWRQSLPTMPLPSTACTPRR
jgi:NAD(P)-dependent dehydrogenase (short-subunit alcohol dehydrogenase family)